MLFRKTIKFFKANMAVSLIYLIMLSLMVFIINFKDDIPLVVRGILILFNVLLLINILITASELIKNESRRISVKKSFFRFDKKKITELLISTIFLVAISTISVGTKVIIAMTPLRDVILNVQRGNYVLEILLYIVWILFISFYDMLIPTTLAHIIYSKGKGTFESIKEGFKTILKLRTLLLFFVILNIVIGFTMPSKEGQSEFKYLSFIIALVLYFFVIIAAFFNFKGLEAKDSLM